MRTAYSAILICLLAGVYAAPAFGSSEVVPGALELYATPSAVGLEVSYSGDDDHNAQAEFVWRKAGEQEWRNGVDMTVSRERKLIWASIWPFEQGEAIEVKVSLRDAGREAAVLEAKVTTRKLILESSAGSAYYVSPAGSDNDSGTEKSPFKTLSHAAGVAKPGDTVYAMTGVYKEGNLFRGVKGTAEKPVIFMAADGEKPVIDSSIEIAEGSAGWQEHGNGIYVADLVLNDGEARYAAQDGLRMFFYSSLPELDADRLQAKRAWCYDEAAGKVYVRTGDTTGPSVHTYNIANTTYGIHLAESEYVVVRGFEIRFCGETCVGVSDASRGCVIYENVLHGAPGALSIRGETVHDTVVWGNTMYEKGLVDFTWNAIKASGYRRQGITCFSGRGSSICHNSVDGFFDCINPEVWRYTDRIDLNRDLDVMFNVLLNAGDDAIEADGGGVNYRIHGNRIRNCFAAISIAPVEKGPLYVTRNDATYKMIMFKMNVGGPESLGWAYCYHNSGYSQITGEAWGGMALSFPPSRTMPISNKTFLNNATIAKTHAIRHAHKGYILDYNCYWTVPGASAVNFTWDETRSETNVYPTIEEFAAATGRETHGMYADPLFVSTPDIGRLDWRDFGPTPLSDYPLVPDDSVGDLHLKADSPCIDAGVVIRGINEDFLGKAPDIGAFEER